MEHLIYTSIAVIFLIAGAASTLLLIFPSLAFMFVITFIYAYIDHFHHLTGIEVSILAGIAVLAEIIDYISGFVGGKIGGASLRSLGIGTMGLILGLIFFPPIGGIFGLFLGILIGELFAVKDIKKAFKAGFAGVLGSLLGTIIKFLLAITYLILFIVFAWK